MPEGHSLSFVLLPTSAFPSADDFRAAWREVAKGAAPPTENKWDGQSIEVELDGVTTIDREAEAAAASSVSAMGTKGFSPAAHVAHLAVVSLSPKASPVERLLRHTRVVAALTKAGHATGVYEGSAHATHDPAFYVDVVARGPDLPLMLWNGISLAKTPDTVELLTLGMAQLGLPDLLPVGPSGQGNDALLFAFNLLGYVISRGGPIPEGETVGRTAAEKLPVTYVPSPLDRVLGVKLKGRQTTGEIL